MSKANTSDGVLFEQNAWKDARNTILLTLGLYLIAFIGACYWVCAKFFPKRRKMLLKWFRR
jgi:hypothetical protein